MKKSTKPPNSDYITKDNLQEALDQQTIQLSKILSNFVTKKDFEETIQKQTKWVQKQFDQQTTWTQKMFDKHTKSFSDLVNNLTIDIGLKFDEQDNRFIQIDKRFEQVDMRFEQIDKKFEQVDLRFEQIDKKFEQVDLRFEQIDKKFEQVAQQFKQVRRDIAESSSMIIDELKASREEQTILGYRQRKHTDQIKDHDTRISILEENFQITS
jgi:archaellum component FlaC